MKIAKKIFVYCLGMFFIAVGVSLSIKSNLGISPVNSIPYVSSLIIGIDQGIAIVGFYLILIFVQALILKKDFKIVNVLQIVFSSIFGYFVTLTNWIFQFESPESYILKLILLTLSMIIISIGLILYLKAEFIPMPPEGFLISITKKTDIEFYRIKITFDLVFIIISGGLSLIFFNKLNGVREGTVLAAIFIGKIIGFLEVKFKKQINKLTDFLE